MGQTTLRDELLRFERLNLAEQHVPTPTALEQLAFFGDRLVPDLIECLTDPDSALREWAVDLLNEIRPRPHAAIPPLIERLSDPDSLVRMAVITALADFGPVAASAIPHLEPWLGLADEYWRVRATTAIMSLDPTRTELLPEIRAALSSSGINVRHVAREFFQKSHTPLPFDEADLKTAVRRHWQYHAACNQVYWSSHLQDDDALEIDAAPVFQEVFGGEDDGRTIWAAYQFDMLGFANEVDCSEVVALSACVEHSLEPVVGIRGSFHGQPFILRLHLVPLANSDTREIYDSLRNEVRAIEEEQL